MTPNQSGEFVRRLNALGELFDAQLSPTKQALYFEALRDLEFQEVARALNVATKACTFMPKPAELRAFAIGTPEDQAERAWLSLRAAMSQIGSYRSLVTHDAALGETVTAMFGSWPAACAADFTPEMWSAKRKEFGRIYHAIRARAYPGGRYLPGLVEQRNGGRPEWVKYTEIGVIGTAGEVRLLSPAEAETERTTLAVQAGQPTSVQALTQLVETRAATRSETA